MNRIKYMLPAHKGGAPIVKTKKANQKRDLKTHPIHGQYWGAPGQLKNRIVWDGFVLVGKRQK